MENLRDSFLLDPNIVFLNHGSFGATPRPVFETYQAWQYELERQPVEFLGRRALTLMEEARGNLAAYLGAQADEIVYFPNPTTALNMVARNLDHLIKRHTGSALQPGDEILTTDHEYGAMNRTWRYICRQQELAYISLPIELPVTDEKRFIEKFWTGVNQRTRIIFISHITSPTALAFPVAEICRRARAAGILSIVDGAHAPGQIPLDLNDIQADLYTGACHKWLNAPKGASFLYARREVQPGLDPLVVSWGYESDRPSPSQYVDYHEWQGTRDLAAFLSVSAAIDFQEQHDWQLVRQHCHDLACQTRLRINSLSNLEPICSEDWFHQMFASRLPPKTDLEELKQRLYNEYHIEVPMVSQQNEKFIRVSFQGYNSPEDADALVEALTTLLPETQTE